MSPKISFVNKPGILDTTQLGMLLKDRGETCPRIVIFLGRIDDCGDVYEDILQVVTGNRSLGVNTIKPNPNHRSGKSIWV